MDDAIIASGRMNGLESADDDVHSTAALRLLARIIARDLSKRHIGKEGKSHVQKIDEPSATGDHS